MPEIQKMNKDKLVSGVVALVGAGVVAGLYWFNYGAHSYAYSYNQYLVGNIMGLLWIPMLSVFSMGESPEKFGFAAGWSKRTGVVLAVLFAVLAILMLGAARMHSFQSYYPIFRRYPEFVGVFGQYPKANPFVGAPLLMLYAEASYGMYLFCWEFFFRGYLLFGLARSIGWWAIIVQALAFGFLHWGKPPVELIGSFGAGVILGIIALRAKSFVPCFAIHWAVSVTFDLMIVAARLH